MGSSSPGAQRHRAAGRAPAAHEAASGPPPALRGICATYIARAQGPCAPNTPVSSWGISDVSCGVQVWDQPSAGAPPAVLEEGAWTASAGLHLLLPDLQWAPQSPRGPRVGTWNLVNGLLPGSSTCRVRRETPSAAPGRAGRTPGPGRAQRQRCGAGAQPEPTKGPPGAPRPEMTRGGWEQQPASEGGAHAM